MDVSKTKWADVSLIKCASYCFFKKSITYAPPPLFPIPYMTLGLTFYHTVCCNMFPVGGRCEAHDETCMLPFEMMQQEENINKCLPPSTFKSSLPLSPPAHPRSPEKPQPHMWHITKEAENMFLELNYHKPSKQDKFPNWLLSQHLLITSFFSGKLVMLVCWVSRKGVWWR